MGMGHSAAYADTVEEGFIEEIAPNELANFKSALEKEGTELDSFAQNTAIGEDMSDFGGEVNQTYDELLTKFESETGLELELSYHDSYSDGDRYDEVDGAFWTVGGVYGLTPAGKKYVDKITRCNWVVFG